MRETCAKLTIKTLEKRQWRRSCVFIVNFVQSSHYLFGNSIVDFQQVNVGRELYFSIQIYAFSLITYIILAVFCRKKMYTELRVRKNAHSGLNISLSDA